MLILFGPHFEDDAFGISGARSRCGTGTSATHKERLSQAKPLPSAPSGRFVRSRVDRCSLAETFWRGLAGYPDVRHAAISVHKLSIILSILLSTIAALIATGCMSSSTREAQRLTTVPAIPAVVSVRAPDRETAESVASDLLALGIFGAVRIDDGSVSDHDLLAIHQAPGEVRGGWFCGEPGGLVILSALTLLITPSCVIERGYALELYPNGSTEVIQVDSEYEATTWMGLQTLLMNFSPDWRWGAPNDEERRNTIQRAILAKRGEILRSLKLIPLETAE